MYFDNIFIHGVPVIFGDASFTFYKINATEKAAVADKIHNPMYHSHFYYECHILLEGETDYSIQGSSVSAIAGNMVIIPPHTEHYPFRQNGSAKEIVLGLALEQTKPESGEFQYFFRTLCEIVKKPLLLSGELLETISHLHDSFQSTEMRENCFRQAFAYKAIVQLFDSVNQFRLSYSVSQTTIKDDNTDITLEIMINDVRSTLTDIAQSLGYSTRHTSRLILQKYGRSLMEIRQKNMITTAKNLMAHTPPLSLETVAIQSGFSSLDAMVRAFRRWENMTPAEYRKRNNLL